MSHHREHAVVVGASMAGLLAARVLSESYDRVTVLDRDEWTDRTAARRGVPHGGHAHGLLASGLAALEQLLPGLSGDLLAEGGIAGDVSEDVSWVIGGGRLAPAATDLHGLVVSRVALERHVRGRVEALPGVTVAEGRGVSGLLVSDTRGVTTVTGVELFASHGPPGPVTTLGADLVVDASGRRSQASAWLHRRGLEAPVQHRVGIDIHYATRWFARRPGDLGGLIATAHAATPEAPRGVVALAQEGDRWVVGLNGYHGDRPPLDLEAYRARARQTDDLVGALVTSAEPLDDGARFGFPASVWNRHDLMGGRPAGFLVVGDALCSFNPVYGSGMSVAALEALALRDVLAGGRPDTVPARFYAATRPVIDTAWRMSTGADLALPGTEGDYPLPARLIGRYLRRYLVAARDDADLATAFLRVTNLMATPASLLAPGRVIRVLGPHRRRESRTARGRDLLRPAGTPGAS